MPWRNMSTQQQKYDFIKIYQKQTYTFKTICNSFGISRKTGYKWLSRFYASGLAGLDDMSKAPKHVHNKTPPEIEQVIVSLKKAHPGWGARKLRAIMTRSEVYQKLPTDSGFHQILVRNRLTRPRKRQRKVAAYTQPFTGCNAPNDVWCADFKGQFRTANGKYCYPLTVTDAFSRFILCCKALDGTRLVHTMHAFESLFLLNGLPKAIRTDNGVPFASHGVGGLTKLSAWWVRQGIIHERIKPGNPQENGRHERMHKTLKAEATIPAKANLSSQQAEFDRFVHEFNHVRPHEALGMLSPASVYKPSEKVYLDCGRMSYAKDMMTRNIRTNGCLKWKCREVFISELLTGDTVGLVPSPDSKIPEFDVYYAWIKIGRLEGEPLRFIGVRNV